MLPILLTVLGQSGPAFDFDYQGSRGLQVRVSGVPVIRGSSVQYYEPGWSKGYYSSNWQPVSVRRVDADTIDVAFTGADGHAHGTETLHREGDRLKIHYHFEWTGDHPVQVELTAGMVQAAPFQNGKVIADGQPGRTLVPTDYPSKNSPDARRFAPSDAKTYQFQATLADTQMTSSVPMLLFDARGYGQEWAEGQSAFWYGNLSLDVAAGKPADLDIEYRFQPHPIAEDRVATVSASTVKLDRAKVPDESIFPLIPKPKNVALDYAKPRELTGVFAFPAGQVRYWTEFKQAVGRRYIVPLPTKDAKAINIDGGVSRMGMHPGAYTINISENGITVLGEEDEGLRNGMFRLARLVYAKGGKLWLPTGHMEDDPKIQFRGVHLFGGPEAKDFHHRLWERVLLPLGMNHVVVQCERTQWESTPIDPSEHPMSKEDLAALFADYRKMGVEPTPLIQSFGHMEWFFAGKKRLDLALNPNEPYAIDPRKPESRQALEKLWNEVFDLLKPKSIHFGCDEVDMVGFSPHDPKLMTDLWVKQIPVLSSIAKAHGAKMMLWGDMALTKGEAPDATNADTKEDAIRRRAVIPEGAMICDWHYKADPNPESFYPTLQLWKREGYPPIASMWFRPENIRGFALASTLEKAGALQTSWAGYDSSERAMVENMPTFTAMILAADYFWSGRQEPLPGLGYDPAEVFRKMYFGEPSLLASKPGLAAQWGAVASHKAEIGQTGFLMNDPIAMRSLLDAGRESAPTSVVVPIGGKGTRLWVAMDMTQILADGDPVAEIVVTFAGGKTVSRKLVYGHQIRAGVDAGAIPYSDRVNGICAIGVDLGGVATVQSVKVVGAGQTAGLRVYGVTLQG